MVLQKITEQEILNIIKENKIGINIYELSKLINKISYSTLYKYLRLMEAKGLLKFKEEKTRIIKKIYLE